MEEKLTVKQWRQLRGYTQKQLADLAGMKFATYHAKENGTRDWKANELMDVCKVLKVSIDTQVKYQ